LEIADMLARPIGLSVLRPTQPKSDSVGSGLTPSSAEHKGKESEYHDDDDHEAAAVRSAAVDASLPLVPEGGFFVHAVRFGLF